jgi:DNA repair protein RadA/Sms
MAIARKNKTAYFCSQCGAEHPRWQGKCRECGEWNALIEQRIQTTKASKRSSAPTALRTLAEIEQETYSGFTSGIGELDRVLGGQLLPGQTVLLGGDPGIGKSTLALQAAEAYSRQGINVLYVTGEESLPQIKRRSERLGVKGERVTVINTAILEEIVSVLEAGNYAVAIIDSVQTVATDQLDSPPGTVAQVREAANRLVNLSKERSSALFLIGHVTKEGLVAGPKVLEHMVDTVVYFEGDSSRLYRILRAAKNRFGSVAEIGIFEMKGGGLAEVDNPSAFFLSGEPHTPRAGAVVAGLCEGHRALLVEIQALVAPATYGNPQRVAGGIDNKKLAILLAILEKRCGYPMATNDVFVSVAGGLRLSAPALDLAILVAIVSSLTNKPISHQSLIVGEVGLAGETRAIADFDRLLSEAAKLGFTTLVHPTGNRPERKTPNMNLVPVADIQAALDEIVG